MLLALMGWLGTCVGWSEAQVVINEIMYNPSTDQGADTGYEWVELYNAGAGSVDLGGWRLWDYSGNVSNPIPTSTPFIA
jgi:hypothetical protein